MELGLKVEEMRCYSITFNRTFIINHRLKGKRGRGPGDLTVTLKVDLSYKHRHGNTPMIDYFLTFGIIFAQMLCFHFSTLLPFDQT